MLCKTGQESNRITVFAQGILWYNTWYFCLHCALLEAVICIVMQPHETVTLTFCTCTYLHMRHISFLSSYYLILYSSLIYYPMHYPQNCFLHFSQFKLLNHCVDYRHIIQFCLSHQKCHMFSKPFMILFIILARLFT